MLSAEWGWLDRCGGPARGDRLNPADYPTVESLVLTWIRVEGYMRAFLAGLRDEDLARQVELAIGAGPKHVPGDFDWLFYSAGRGSVPV